MNFFQIECFLELSKHLNYTKAAQTLFVAQPVLSRTLASLEDEVGVKLVERNSRSVKLTHAGEIFKGEAEILLRQFNNGLDKTKLAAKGVLGKFTIGVYDEIFDSFMADTLIAFQKAYPNIEVNMIPYSQSGLFKAFYTGEADVIFAVDFNDASLSSIPLYNIQMCAVVANEHAFADKKSIHFSEMCKEPFISMTRASSPLYDLLIQLALEAGFNPNIVAQSEFNAALLMMVACNKGVSIMYDVLERLSDGRVNFIPIEGCPPKTMNAYMRIDGQNPSLVYFMEFLREYCRTGEIK